MVSFGLVDADSSGNDWQESEKAGFGKFHFAPETKMPDFSHLKRTKLGKARLVKR